jgi:glycosyltransferase involved in cell wall biosynthesis
MQNTCQSHPSTSYTNRLGSIIGGGGEAESAPDRHSGMRILVISEVSGYMPGGVPASMVQLIRGLAARGHALGLAGDVVPRGAEAARHFRVTLPSGPSLAEEVGQAIAAFAPDVVHVIAMGSRGLDRLATVLAPHPWGLTCHSLPPHERKLPALHGHEGLHYAVRGLRFLPNALAWKWLLRRPRVPWLVVHSETMYDTVRHYGFDEARIVTIPLGCEAVRAAQVVAPRRPGDGPRILTIGGIAHTKGQHDALQAVARLRHDFPRLAYRIVGEVRDRSYLKYVEGSIERLALQDCVRITPTLPPEEKDQALRETDLYLQPSHEEGFCLTYIEAAAVVPRLIGTDTGAIRLIGAGDPGTRTVPVRQPARMAEAIRELLEAPLPDGLMAQRAARLAERFSWARYLDAHEALYRRCIRSGMGTQILEAGSFSSRF